MSALADKAMIAKRESRVVDFKGEMDLTLPATWPEIVKDIVAMANTGGGVIAIGLDNTGVPTGNDVSQVLGLDPATVVDQLYK
jgi:predicted HTH transcriptional regulator